MLTTNPDPQICTAQLLHYSLTSIYIYVQVFYCHARVCGYPELQAFPEGEGFGIQEVSTCMSTHTSSGRLVLKYIFGKQMLTIPWSACTSSVYMCNIWNAVCLKKVFRLKTFCDDCRDHLCCSSSYS